MSGASHGLIADIGGTNARFAMVSSGTTDSPSYSHVHKLKCTAHPGLADAVREYYRHTGIDVRPSAACFAVAGPVVGGVIDLTNHVWRTTVGALETELGLDRVIAINDFEAVGHAAAVAGPEHLFNVGDVADPRSTSRKKSYAVTGPGTGLGVAILTMGVSDEPVVTATEGGHVSFAPRSDQQREIVRVLTHEYARLSVERLLSGPGLVNIHRALAVIHGRDEPDYRAADISRLALEGDPICREALDEFYDIFGSFAGDLALITGAQSGIFIGGGILPPLKEDFAGSRFRQAFEDKGRFCKYNKDIPTKLLISDDPGLTGAAAVMTRYLAAHEDD